MAQRKTGEYIISSTGGERVRTYVPYSLPPHPPLEITPDRQNLLDRALLSLGRLDSITTILPDTSLFLYMYIRKEAVLSSQIEGTQSSLSDLLIYELSEVPGVPLDEIKEVSNYVAIISWY